MNDLFRKCLFLLIVILFIGFSNIPMGFGIKNDECNNNFLNELYSSPKDSPIYTKTTYMVPMRDGIHLATDVYLSDGGSPPHGAIIIRTPYNKNNSNYGGWADAGWPIIVQDMRGRFQSEGIDTVFRNSHTDGPDTLAWIASQKTGLMVKSVHMVALQWVLINIIMQEQIPQIFHVNILL